MLTGNLINDLIALVERAEARFKTDDDRHSKLTCWGAFVMEQAPNYEVVNQNLAGVA